jgi:hypothetical protein
MSAAVSDVGSSRGAVGMRVASAVLKAELGEVHAGDRLEDLTADAGREEVALDRYADRHERRRPAGEVCVESGVRCVAGGPAQTAGGVKAAVVGRIVEERVVVGLVGGEPATAQQSG